MSQYMMTATVILRCRRKEVSKFADKIQNMRGVEKVVIVRAKKVHKPCPRCGGDTFACRCPMHSLIIKREMKKDMGGFLYDRSGGLPRRKSDKAGRVHDDRRESRIRLRHGLRKARG